MRYQIEKTYPKLRIGWAAERKTFTLWGARRVWWRYVNRTYPVLEAFRIVDTKTGEVVQ